MCMIIPNLMYMALSSLIVPLEEVESNGVL